MRCLTLRENLLDDKSNGVTGAVSVTVIVWTDDRVVKLERTLKIMREPSPGLMALPHPTQALIPEIPGPLGHCQPPAEGASRTESRQLEAPGRDPQGEEEEKQQAAIKKTPGASLPGRHSLGIRDTLGREPPDQPCPLSRPHPAPNHHV